MRNSDETVKYIVATPAGPDLDRMIAVVLFQQELDDCDLDASEAHIQGSRHFQSLLTGEFVCCGEVPCYSTNWELGRALLEWLTVNFSSFDVFWDCNHWGCTVNDQDAQGVWHQVCLIPNAPSMLEAICKAALISRIAPKSLPLSSRYIVVEQLKAPTRKRKKTKKKAKVRKKKK